MKKKARLSPLTIVLFSAAMVLLLISTVGGTRAALNVFSENYSSRVEMYDIGVTLNENGISVAHRDYIPNSNGEWDTLSGILLGNMLQEGEQLKLGKAYDERISVTNSGSIDEYVRVNLYKYWLDKDGKKIQSLSPDLIRLNLVNLDSAWLVDEDASTPERTVLYYNQILRTGETTPDLSDRIIIDDIVMDHVTQTVIQDGSYTRIINTYDYDGVTFQVEVEVDAVQTHNAVDAIYSAWGRKVSTSGDSLSLVN